MYTVETYAAVRHFVFVEGRSRREAARVFGVSRDTIDKMFRFSEPPGYQRKKPPAFMGTSAGKFWHWSVPRMGGASCRGR